jgi:hypothetical protein
MDKYVERLNLSIQSAAAKMLKAARDENWVLVQSYGRDITLMGRMGELSEKEKRQCMTMQQ